MMKKTVWRIFFLIVAALAVAAAVLLLYPYGSRQEDGHAGKSLALTMLEKSLSSPGQRVSISNIDSLWSSHGVIRSVTVADEQGVFASVKNITFDWSRLSLLRGRMAFEKLTAERIDILRKPAASQTAASAPVKTKETGHNLLALPSLPVDVMVDKIAVKQIVLGESLLGNRAIFGLDGSLHWTRRVFNVKLNLPQLDGAGGAIAIAAQKPSPQDGLTFSVRMHDPVSGLKIQGEGEGTADGFPRQMMLDLSLYRKNGQRALVPFTNGDITLDRAVFHLAYGKNGRAVWNGTAAVDGLASPAVGWKGATFTFGGPAEYLDDPTNRHLGVKLDGTVEGLHMPSVLGSTAQQDKITFHADTDWRAGAPLAIRAANIKSANMALSLSGSLAPEKGATSIHVSGWQLLLDKLEAHKAATVATLKRPAKITLTDNSMIGIQDLALAVGQGSLMLNGTIADKIRLDLDVQRLPLAIVNMVYPDLAADGMLTAKAKISGSRNNPVIDADINGHGVTTAVWRGYGLQPLDVRAQAKTTLGTLRLDAHVQGGGLNAAAKGTVSFKTRKIALDLNLQETPLNLLNSFVKDQNLSGVITGMAQISGTFDNPSATFKVSGRQLSATALTASGVEPLTLQTTGSFANHTVQLENFHAGSASGVEMKASGRLPLKSGSIDLKIDGGAPLGLANRFLAKRGAQLTGVAQVNIHVSGSLSAPKLQGAFLVENGQFVDPQTNARFNNIILRGQLAGDKIVLEKASAKSASGGSLSISGSVSTDVRKGLPADLTITLNHMAYNDGVMVAATANGAVTITGALLHEPLVQGKVQIEKAEITIPDNFGGAALINIRHRHPSHPVAVTLRRAGLDEIQAPKVAVKAHDGGLKLDLVLSANRVFIRGRGLDAKMGGGVRLVGYLSNVHPVGNFDLVRGRFDILTKRLNFESGRVTMTGNMNPDLYFVARSEGDDVSVTVTVSGTPDDLDIALTSQPALPQDEILSRLVFNRSVSELSPFQIAQLGMAAAQLAGVGGNSSLFGNLRGATGLDDLDVTNDGMGNTSVKAGRYIRDNIYLGVAAGSDGATGGTLNLDINKHLKAKGLVGSETKSGLGVFYEKDY